MINYIDKYALFLMVAFCTSCGQSQTNVPKDNIKSETKDIVTSPGSNDPNIHTKYEYAAKPACQHVCHVACHKA
jgi:hypothetical protein